MPKDWANRRITLYAEYVNSHVAVYVDGKKVGEIAFPSGELDLTLACPPGDKHVLSLLVAAAAQHGLPQYSYDNPTGRSRGSVKRRGLCGDVYLIGTPAGDALPT